MSSSVSSWMFPLYGAIKSARPKSGAPNAAPPPPPTVDDTAGAQQDYADQLAKRKGRASTILTNSSSQGAPTTASKTLLGQ